MQCMIATHVVVLQQVVPCLRTARCPCLRIAHQAVVEHSLARLPVSFRCQKPHKKVLMLQKTQAVLALQDGCSRLGLSSSTATALVQFLSVKRTHDQYVAAESRQLRMSPGAKLDRLWHFMLLNTDVSTVVHEQLGGVVAHRGIDSTDLSDESKLLQRLYALNIMRLEGTQPDVALCTEPGTSMHTLHLTASSVPDLQHLPGGGRLYVTPSLTQQQQTQLVQALTRLYAQDQQDASGSNAPQLQHAKRAVEDAAAETPAKRACGAQEQVQASRCRGAQQQQQQPRQAHGSDSELLTLAVEDPMGGQTCFKVKRQEELDGLMQAFADMNGLDRTACVFLYDGNRLFPDQTPVDFSMEDGDKIWMRLQQTGC